MPVPDPMRVMIAGVGYSNLRDLSAGPMLVPQLCQMAWPAGIEIADWSFGPIAVVQQLEERSGYYDRIVLVSAVARGRQPGQVTCSRWDGVLPDPEEIQERVGEAVMGVISLDNLLIIGQHFGVWPGDVRVIEVEPASTDFGLDFTPCVEASRDELITAIRRAALDVGHG